MIQRPASPYLLVGLLFFGLFLITANFTMSMIASPYIVGDLGGSRSISYYTLSFFGFGAALTIPLAKPLKALYPQKKIFLAVFFLFSATCLLCASAPTYFFFNAFRMMTGMCVGPFYALLARHLLTLVSEKEKGTIIWIFVTILVVVPVLGAAWGGVIAYLYSWRAPFFIDAATGALLCWCISRLKDSQSESELCRNNAPFDWIGWGFYAVGIFCLTFCAATAQQLDWYRSPLLVWFALVGTVCFAYFFFRTFYHPQPVLDFRLFSSPIFSLAMLSLALLFSLYFAMVVLLAIWLTFDVRFTPVWIAVLIGHMAIAGFLPRMILQGKLGSADPRVFLLAAAAILAISCFYTTEFDFIINFGRVAFSRILAGFGLALFLPPIFIMISKSHPDEKWIDVFEMFQTVRNLSSGLGVAIFSITWQRRTVFYHERLSEGLNTQAEPVDHFLRQFETYFVPGAPLFKLDDFLNRRAASLALDDVFYLMGWILVGLIFVLSLSLIYHSLRPKQKEA